MAEEQQSIKAVRNYGEAFRSPTVIRMSVLYFFWGLSLFGFVLWLPTILKDAASASIVRTGWLSAGPMCLPRSDADHLGGVRSDARSAVDRAAVHRHQRRRVS
jgi:hypothetical protein